ncbi:VOC family protein [Actinocatenispora rupis]|uniref:Glyoxalase n=1 Tax=Actinocatenispora rupis TaxID=519421 RepID=A0A8J3JBD0_9ACTN|nr:VOC family protein [Actinocatenispora rupis]GID12883.1 glyoxalase [Actinocatenispora rupis]
MTTNLTAIGLVTRDLAASLAFYRLLGVEVPEDAAGPHAEATLPSGLRLMWDTVDLVRSLDRSWEPPSGGVRVGLCFECADAAAVDDLYRTLTGAGHVGHLAPFDAPWGQRYASVRDPDGNGVDLFA